MYKKILYPTDFSETSGLVLEHLKTFKELGGEEVIILHVIEEEKTKNILSSLIKFFSFKKDEAEREVINKLKHEAEEKINKIKEELEKYGYSVKCIIDSGSPHKKIVKYAENEDVNVIIMGSHGETNLKEILLGSVTEYVVKNTTKPVLIINRK